MSLPSYICTYIYMRGKIVLAFVGDIYMYICMFTFLLCTYIHAMQDSEDTMGWLWLVGLIKL